MSTTYGEPVLPATGPVVPAVPAGGDVVPVPAGALVTDAALPPAPPAPPAPVPDVPAPGTIARYAMYDSYASPARERDQLVLVTGYENAGTPEVRVTGVVLGFADGANQAHFLPGQLTWQ
jgi:hypothetical protein